MHEARRRRELDWLREVTAIPTAAGREHRVIAWIERWLRTRRHLRLERDDAGNLLIRPRAGLRRVARGRAAPRPILVTAHLDHPAFVALRATHQGVLGDLVSELDPPPATKPPRAASARPAAALLESRGRFLLCEFRGGVNRPYFDDAEVEAIDSRDRPHRGRIVAVSEVASPHRRVIVRLSGTGAGIAAGDVVRWRLPAPRITQGLLFTHACDDLAAVAAALALLDRTSRAGRLPHVGVLFTRAEEIGFVGAIAAARSRSIDRRARLLCLENSRSFAESPIGGGPIVRVGDRLSVFSPGLTNAVAAAAEAHAAAEKAKDREFRWQRKLMPGGACEATAFAAYGYESTCLCLALGHYHNMSRIDEVAAGERPARVAPEFISVADYHGLIDLLEAVIARLDEPGGVASRRPLMEKLYAERRGVLES